MSRPNIIDLYKAEKHTVKFMQFGEGNFLRAFVDYMIDVANEKVDFDAGVAIVKPIDYGNLDAFKKQDNIYTLILRGVSEGKTINESRIIKSIAEVMDAREDYAHMCETACLDTLRFVVSNTTEAGIVFDDTDKFELEPPATYPGKLTKMLYLRWKAFNGAADKGLIMLPVELIDTNGAKLKECVNSLAKLWGLEENFIAWVNECNIFCNTLVDRIVTGNPRDEKEALCEKAGYDDDLMDIGEPFGLWVIASDRIDEVKAELPLDKAGMPVVFTDNIKPYRERKVRVLNGAHTSLVLGAYLAGLDTVGDCMADTLMRKYIDRAVFDEIVPLVPLPLEEVKAFAASVMERFENPFIRHQLLSIALNSVSKWRARVLPSVIDYVNTNGKLPEVLTFSFAALAAFYSKGERDGVKYEVRDDAAVIEFFTENSALSSAELIAKLVAREDFWGMNLGELNGFADYAAAALEDIRTMGAKAAIEKLLA